MEPFLSWDFVNEYTNSRVMHMDDNTRWYILRMNGAKHGSKHELQIPLLYFADNLGTYTYMFLDILGCHHSHLASWTLYTILVPLTVDCVFAIVSYSLLQIPAKVF